MSNPWAEPLSPLPNPWRKSKAAPAGALGTAGRRSRRSLNRSHRRNSSSRRARDASDLAGEVLASYRFHDSLPISPRRDRVKPPPGLHLFSPKLARGWKGRRQVPSNDEAHSIFSPGANQLPVGVTVSVSDRTLSALDAGSPPGGGEAKQRAKPAMRAKATPRRDRKVSFQPPVHESRREDTAHGGTGDLEESETDSPTSASVFSFDQVLKARAEEDEVSGRGSSFDERRRFSLRMNPIPHTALEHVRRMRPQTSKALNVASAWASQRQPVGSQGVGEGDEGEHGSHSRMYALRALCIRIMRKHAQRRTLEQVNFVMEWMRSLNLSTFQRLSDITFFQLCEVLQYQHLPAGSVLFREGDPSDRLYILLQGKVSLYMLKNSAEDSAPEAPEAPEAEKTTATPATDDAKTHLSSGSVVPLQDTAVTTADSASLSEGSLSDDAMSVAVPSQDPEAGDLSRIRPHGLYVQVGGADDSVPGENSGQSSVSESTTPSLIASSHSSRKGSVTSGLGLFHRRKRKRRRRRKGDAMHRSSVLMVQAPLAGDSSGSGKTLGMLSRQMTQSRLQVDDSSKGDTEGNAESDSSEYDSSEESDESANGRVSKLDAASFKFEKRFGPCFKHIRADPNSEASVFGEMGLLSDDKRSCTIVTDESSELLVLEKADFQRLLAAEFRMEKEATIGILRSVALFKDVGESTLQRLAATVEKRFVKAGTVLCKQGEPVSSMFIVLSGQCSLFRGVDVDRNEGVVGGLPEVLAKGREKYVMNRKLPVKHWHDEFYRANHTQYELPYRYHRSSHGTYRQQLEHLQAWYAANRRLSGDVAGQTADDKHAQVSSLLSRRHGVTHHRMLDFMAANVLDQEGSKPSQDTAESPAADGEMFLCNPLSVSGRKGVRNSAVQMVKSTAQLPTQVEIGVCSVTAGQCAGVFSVVCPDLDVFALFEYIRLKRKNELYHHHLRRLRGTESKDEAFAKRVRSGDAVAGFLKSWARRRLREIRKERASIQKNARKRQLHASGKGQDDESNQRSRKQNSKGKSQAQPGTHTRTDRVEESLKPLALTLPEKQRLSNLEIGPSEGAGTTATFSEHTTHGGIGAMARDFYAETARSKRGRMVMLSKEADVYAYVDPFQHSAKLASSAGNGVVGSTPLLSPTSKTAGNDGTANSTAEATYRHTLVSASESILFVIPAAEIRMAFATKRLRKLIRGAAMEHHWHREQALTSRLRFTPYLRQFAQPGQSDRLSAARLSDVNFPVRQPFVRNSHRGGGLAAEHSPEHTTSVTPLPSLHDAQRTVGTGLGLKPKLLHSFLPYRAPAHRVPNDAAMATQGIPKYLQAMKHMQSQSEEDQATVCDAGEEKTVSGPSSAAKAPGTLEQSESTRVDTYSATEIADSVLKTRVDDITVPSSDGLVGSEQTDIGEGSVLVQEVPISAPSGDSAGGSALHQRTSSLDDRDQVLPAVHSGDYTCEDPSHQFRTVPKLSHSAVRVRPPVRRVFAEGKEPPALPFNTSGSTIGLSKSPPLKVPVRQQQEVAGQVDGSQRGLSHAWKDGCQKCRQCQQCVYIVTTQSLLGICKERVKQRARGDYTHVQSRYHQLLTRSRGGDRPVENDEESSKLLASPPRTEFVHLCEIRGSSHRFRYWAWVRIAGGSKEPAVSGPGSAAEGERKGTIHASLTEQSLAETCERCRLSLTASHDPQKEATMMQKQQPEAAQAERRVMFNIPDSEDEESSPHTDDDSPLSSPTANAQQLPHTVSFATRSLRFRHKRSVTTMNVISDVGNRTSAAVAPKGLQGVARLRKVIQSRVLRKPENKVPAWGPYVPPEGATLYDRESGDVESFSNEVFDLSVDSLLLSTSAEITKTKVDEREQRRQDQLARSRRQFAQAAMSVRHHNDRVAEFNALTQSQAHKSMVRKHLHVHQRMHGRNFSTPNSEVLDRQRSVEMRRPMVIQTNKPDDSLPPIYTVSSRAGAFES